MQVITSVKTYTVDTLISLFPFFKIKSREKGLITKEYVVTDTHLSFVLSGSNKTF